MGVLFIDSFDHYTSLPGKWDEWDGNLAIGSGGRFSTNKLYPTWGGTYIRKNLGANKATIYCGCAIYYTGTYTEPCWMMWDNTTGQCYLLINTDCSISAYRSRPDTSPVLLGTTSPGVITTNAWRYLEVKWTISDSAGVCEIHVDGTQVLNLTSQNTRMSSNNYATKVSPIAGWGYAKLSIDDVYVADDQFYGDCRVQCVMPTGAGNYSQWTPSAGNNWDCVDEKPPVTTDYVSEGTVGQIDTYAVENLTPTSGTVYAVAGNFYCQKTDAGSRQIAIATRLSSTDDAGSGIAVPSSWGWVQDIKATKPGGGSWSISDVNNCEMGQKMIA